MIDASNPGADLLGSTSAALAAASSVFQHSDPAYSATLLAASQTLFRWGTAAIQPAGGNPPAPVCLSPAAVLQEDLFRWHLMHWSKPDTPWMPS